MKVLMHQTALLELLERVVGVLKKGTLPGLECVRLEVKDNSVRATATDLETWLSASSKCQADEDGVIITSGKELSEIVRLLPKEDVSLEASDKQLVIKSQGSKFKISLVDEKDYPKKPVFSLDGFIEIPRESFQNALASVSSTMSKNNYQGPICGVLLEFKDSKLTLVGTDGHRLGKMNLPVQSTKPQKIILPADIVKHIRKMEGDSVRLSINETITGVYGESLELTSRLLDGQYPDYEKVIPQDNDKKLLIAREPLIQALRQIEVFAQRVNQIARLMLLKNTSELILVSEGEGFESEVGLECQYSGDEIEIGFNAKYLLEILSTIKSEQVEWTLKDPVSPMILTPVNENDELYLLMPVRLG